VPKFQILIEDRAFIEIQNAYEFYEGRQEGLGIRFNQEVNNAIDLLKQTPFFQIRYDNFRCYPLKNFPYMIHYEIAEASNTVTIYGVIHTSMNPTDQWL